MKAFSTGTATVALIAVLAGAAFAQQSQNNPPAQGAAPPSSSAPTDAKPADQLTRVLGRISAVDTKAKTITLSGFGGQADQTLAYDDNTKYMLDIPAAVSDIKVGDTLRMFTFGGGGDAGATTISPNIVSIVPPVDIKGPPFTGYS